MLIKSWEKVAAKYEKDLNGKTLTKAVYSITGGNINPDDLPEKGTHLSSIFIEMLPTEDRHIFYKDIMEEWNRQTGYVSGAEEVLFEGYIGGPPTADIDVIFRGDEESIILASKDFQRHLEGYSGIYDITSSYKKGKTEFLIEMTPEADNFGISLETLASQLRDNYYGNEVMKIQRKRDEVRVMLRLPSDERKKIAGFNNLKVRNSQGVEVPVSVVAKIRESSSFSVIERENGKRFINVQATVVKGINAKDIMAEIKAEYLPAVSSKFNVSADVGYRAQDTEDTQVSMKEGFGVAVMVIYLIIATIFKSYVQPMIIVFTIPFGIIGAIFGHFIYGIPISTMSFFGMIALTGVVVNDSIVYIEAVNNKLHQGMKLDEALIAGGKLRFRAIILTTLTTFGGIFPMILEKSLQAQVLVPMAISVAFGLVFATFSTLIAIPCLLAIGNDIRRFAHILVHGKTATSEEVEPRSSDYYVKKNRGGMV
jgi:multidrug efflux pump subunit AcrB